MKESETVYNAVLEEPTSQQDANQVKIPKLGFCVVMDLVGMASYIVPGLGEWFDVAWAPISGLIFMKSFGGMTGKIGGLISMVEEAAPFVDVIPTFTIGYFYTKYQTNKKK